MMWLNYIDLAPALISGSNTFFHINKTNCEDEIIDILQFYVDCKYKRDFPPCNECSNGSKKPLWMSDDKS